MQRTIELNLARVEGALIRAIGLIERRGYVVTAIDTRDGSSSETLQLRLEVASRGRPFDVLIRQIGRLLDVRAARLVEPVTNHSSARVAC